MDLKVNRSEDIDWIRLAQNRAQWRIIVKAVMNLRVRIHLDDRRLYSFGKLNVFESNRDVATIWNVLQDGTTISNLNSWKRAITRSSWHVRTIRHVIVRIIPPEQSS
jgi:hypothetical protein